MSECKCAEQIARLRIRLRILERYMAETLLKKDRIQLRKDVPVEDHWPLEVCKTCKHIRQEHAYNMYFCQRRVDPKEQSRIGGARCDCNEFIFEEVLAE